MKTLDLKTLKKFLKLAGDRLKGEWVLIGGTVLPLLNRDLRSTVDIDLISLTSPEQGQAQALQLMEISESLGLPVETINQAGAYFLSKIPGFPSIKKELVLLHQGKSATIFRPGPTLYLLLKIKRLSESDLLDCLEWLKFLRSEKEACDVKRVSKALESEISASTSEEKTKRLRELLLKLNK